MRLTNRFNLPAPVVAAVSSDDYVRGDADYTATELITPTRILSLRRRHPDKIVEDVADRIWAMHGQLRHTLLERIAKADPGRYIVEQRLETTLPGGKKISGQIDLFDLLETILYDYKEASVFKFLLGDTREWEEQSNVNAYLLRKSGVTITALKNIVFLKDFKVREARMAQFVASKKDYPQCPVHIVNLPLWSIGEAEAFILGKIKAHDENMAAPPVCTKKERWQRDAVFALMHRDRKRALRLFDNRDQAEAAMVQKMRLSPPGETKKFYIEERGAEPVRCLDFCEVQTFCDFGMEAEKKWREKAEAQAKHES